MSTKSSIVLISILYCLGFSSAWSEEDDEYHIQRQNMVKEILIDAQLTSAEIGKDELDKRVIKAMGETPRHQFVPSHQVKHAYENRPLPIGYGQTISQPYIVALMTDLLQPDENDIALEIGTGSGYQAAVLAGLVKHIYTIEIIKPLGTVAKERLTALGYDNATTRIGDGYYGWQEYAPFDLIIVTAASGSIPPPLIQQLKPGGRLVIPIGGIFLTQQLMLVEKDIEGGVKTRQILPVRFVPLTRNRKVD